MAQCIKYSMWPVFVEWIKEKKGLLRAQNKMVETDYV